MATEKLSPKQVKKLVEIGIKATDEKKAKELLLEFLEKNDIEGVEDYDIDQLIEMAEVFYEPSDSDDDEEEEVEEEEEEDEDEESDEDIDDEDEELEELEEDEEDEEPTPKKVTKSTPKPAVKLVVKSIAKKSKVVEEDEEELLDEVVEEVKTKKITTKQAKPIPPPVVKKQNTTGAGRKVELSGEKWDGRNDKKHFKMIEPFIEEFFGKEEFQIDILKQGFTIRSLGNNAKTTVFNFDELRILDGELVGNLYCNRFKSVDDLCELLQDDLQEPEKVIGMFRGESHPCIRKITQSEVFEVFNSDVLKEALKRANHTDVKMGKNREKLEESLTKSKKK
jgi:hypothetical protein